MRTPRSLLLSAAVATAASLLSADGALATQALNAGQPIGSTSAKLMKKPYSSLTNSQKNKVIADPPAPPAFGSTSFYYDRENYVENGFVRANLDGIEAGPGYEITGGLVELQQQFVRTGGSANDGRGVEEPCCAGILYQELDDFFQFGIPDGYFETGYLQVFFELTNPNAAGPVDTSQFEAEGYELIAQDGVVPGSEFDTYVLDFDVPLDNPNEDPLIFYRHFANPDGPAGPDRFLVPAENGGGLINIPAQNISDSVVPIPEPATAGVALILGLSLLGARRRRD